MSDTDRVRAWRDRLKQGHGNQLCETGHWAP
jgi:hypothetical protein